MVFSQLSPPTTVLGTWEGVTVLRGQDSTWITVDRCFEPDCFDEAIRLLGFTGREDYEVLYDPGTGRETFIFDEQGLQAAVRPVRNQDVGGVLPGLSSGGS